MTTVLLKEGYLGFHVSLGECRPLYAWRGLGFGIQGFRGSGF